MVVAPHVACALDGVRAFAAFYVVIHHVAASRGLVHGLGIFTKFGQEMVITFFLLSGFVIFANESHRIADLRGYAFRRILRIYPGLIASILISSLVFYLNGNLSENFSAKSLLCTLFAFQDTDRLKPGVIASPYLDNEPLWSLSYEIFFYFLFPAIYSFWIRHPKYTNLAVWAFCLAAYIVFTRYPNHWCLVLAYFGIWWAGAMAAHTYGQGVYALRGLKAQIAGLAILVFTSVTTCFMLDKLVVFYQYPALQARHFIAALFILLFSCSKIASHLALLVYNFKNIVNYLASISFGIYILHWPLLVQWQFSYDISGFMLALTVLIISSVWVDRFLGRRAKEFARRQITQ